MMSSSRLSLSSSNLGITPKLTGIYPHVHGRPWHTNSLGRDFYHYLGSKKPWISSNPITADDLPKTPHSEIYKLEGRDVWLYWLRIANETFGCSQGELDLPTTFPDLKSVSPFPQVRDQRFALFEPTIDIPIPAK